MPPLEGVAATHQGRSQQQLAHGPFQRGVPLFIAITIRGLLRLALSLCVALVLAGCASGGLPAAPSQAAKATIDNDAYQIGAGDTLNVLVWRNPDLSGT